jgi:allophanate hydrolase subunit 2
MSLRVLDPGLYTLIVDLGRTGSRSLGVPVGGAADRTSLILGNALVGNPPEAAALEISLAGPTLRADTELACVVYGAPFMLSGSRHQKPESLAAGKTFTLHAGEELQIAGTAAGMRAYFCVRGGIHAPTILGSRSALKPLAAGQDLVCRPGTILPRSLNRPVQGLSDPETLRVIAGAQAGWFDPTPL